MMPVRQRRKKTAKEIATAFNVCERTVRNHVAEDRNDYEVRAEERRKIAGEMKADGESWETIAKAIGGSMWAARALVRRYEQLKNTND
jgi:predicted transcriptional regulator